MNSSTHENEQGSERPRAYLSAEGPGGLQDNHEPPINHSPPPAASGVHRSDPVLIKKCLDGDDTAWKELVDRYGRLVYSIPRRYGLSQADAEDVFQDVFTIVLRQLGSLRDQTRLSAWLITITHRQTQHLVMRLPKSPDAGEEEPLIEPLQFEEIQRWERRHMLHEAISELDPRCQEFLRALLQESAPNYEELAARLGLAVGSIGPTRARCFKKLEAILIASGFEG